MVRKRRSKKSNSDPLLLLVVCVVIMGIIGSSRVNSDEFSLSFLVLIAFGVVVACSLAILIYYEIRKRNNALKAVELIDIDSMKGIDFENYLAILFESLGYKVTKTPASGDLGVDLVLVKNKQKTVVQAKKYKNSVNQKAVREAVAGVAAYKADKSMVVTNSAFTPLARVLAIANDCELVDRVKLGELIIKFQNKK